MSLFRSARLKARVPARYLARLESPLQEPLGHLAPSPSVYIASRNGGRAAIAESPASQMPETHAPTA